MRLIDADALKEKLLKERDAIPLTRTERYGFGVEFPNHHGESMRGGIKKALRCMEQTPTIDAVPVETVAQMFFDFTGDKCPCNFNNNDEWLPSVCEYEAEGKCPDPEDVLGCWKQYIKHYGERKDGEG